MPWKDSEGPPNPQDRVTEPGRGIEDEPRNFGQGGSGFAGNYDTAQSYPEMDDPDINTHGSER